MMNKQPILILILLTLVLGLFIFQTCTEEMFDIVYFHPNTINTINDITFVEVNGEPFYAIGYDTKTGGPWDGVTGPGECDGAYGILPIAVEMSQLAVDYGANFAYVWSYSSSSFDVNDTLVATNPQIYGKWPHDYGTGRDPSNDVIPIMYNAHGESDMDGGCDPDKIEGMVEGFEEFKNRTGRFSAANMPNLPPYEELKWYAWHPTWRMEGEGDCSGEELSSEFADMYAQTTNMMIGNSYTYVQNRWECPLCLFYGQKGEKGEGYEDWLAADDPEHRSYFSAGWNLSHSLVQRKNEDTVVWMWMQGHAFNDDIGLKVCQNGTSDLWAMGPFPSMAYLRKEITSTIAAGATGIIFFGYMYCRPPEAEKVRILMRALSHPQVYEPALISPRLDLGTDLTNIGEGGRVHAIAKWHADTRTAYVIGANPGAHSTEFSINFPWSIAKAEILDWDTPQFVIKSEVRVRDNTLIYEAPRDDGFIIRITPYFLD